MYAGGWFRCPGCVLAASRDGSTNAGGSARLAELACDWVELESSAVGPSATSTHEDGRRRYTRFVTNVAGAQPWNGDLNYQLFCLLVTHAVQSGLSKSTLEGTLSALADWQRSRGGTTRRVRQPGSARAGHPGAGPLHGAQLPQAKVPLPLSFQ
jgi:hypothetical protein